MMCSRHHQERQRTRTAVLAFIVLLDTGLPRPAVFAQSGLGWVDPPRVHPWVDPPRRGAVESSTSRCQESRFSSAMRSAQVMGSWSAADWAGVRAARELRSRASSRLRVAVLMRASLARAPWHRRRRRTARPYVASRR